MQLKSFVLWKYTPAYHATFIKIVHLLDYKMSLQEILRIGHLHSTYLKHSTIMEYICD